MINPEVKMEDWYDLFLNNYQKPLARKFTTLYNFLNNKNTLTKQQVKQLFETIHFNLSEDELEFGTERWFLFYCIFIKPFSTEYFSDHHNRFIRGYCD